MKLGIVGTAALGMLAWGTTVAHAQVIGTFSWQTQPYCNVVTLTVVQQGGMYQATGVDDLCGAGAAPSTGTAIVTGSGVAVGITVVLPTGLAAHLAATVNVSNGSGTWTDADGNTGPFVLGASSGGSPRPAPTSPAAITVNQFAPSVYGGTGTAATVARSDHTHDDRYFTRTQALTLARPRLQTVTYSGSTGRALSTVSPPTKFRDLGSFTTSGGAVKLTWRSHITSAGVACNFQIRVDGQPAGTPTGSGLVGDEAITQGTVAGVPVAVVSWFPNLAAGNHSVELWLRNVASSCDDNLGNYVRTVLVEEYGVTP
jgi:hypothetical protein